MFIGINRFVSSRKVNCKIYCLIAVPIEASSWFETKTIIDEFHKHFYGYVNFTDFKL